MPDSNTGSLHTVREEYQLGKIEGNEHDIRCVYHGRITMGHVERNVRAVQRKGVTDSF